MSTARKLPTAPAARSKSTERQYAAALRLADQILGGAPATDASVAECLAAMQRCGYGASTARTVTSAFNRRSRRQGDPPPCGPQCRAAFKAFPKQGRRPRTVSADTEAQYRRILRRLDIHLQGAAPTDAGLADFIRRRFAERGLGQAAARAVITAAGWDADRQGRRPPQGPLTQAVLNAMPQRSQRRGAPAESTERKYAEALRRVEQLLDGAPATDASVAECLAAMQRRGYGASAARTVITALNRRSRRQGCPPPCGPQCRAALKAFPKQSRRPRKVSADTEAQYRRNLRRLDAHLQGAAPTDAGLADFIRRQFVERGLSQTAARAVITAAGWEADRQGRHPPCGPQCRAALKTLPKQVRRPRTASADTEAQYRHILRRLDAHLQGAAPTDAGLADFIRSQCIERGLGQAAARAVITAAGWEADRQGRRPPQGPLTRAALATLPKRAQRRPDRLSPTSRSQYESALRKLDAATGGAPTTDAVLSAHLRGMLAAGEPLHRAVLTASAAAWRRTRQGQPTPRGRLTRQALEDFQAAHRQGRLPAMRRRPSNTLNAATRALYDSALQRLRAQKVPLTDAGLADHLSALRQQGKSVGVGRMALTAAAWDARENGRPNPVGPLTKKALAQLKPARSKSAAGRIAPKTQAGYESALRSIRKNLGGDPATDERLAAHVESALRHGLTVLTVSLHISAAVWWAQQQGIASPRGPLTQAALGAGAPQRAK